MSISIIKTDEDLRVVSKTVLRKKAFIYDWAVVYASRARIAILLTQPETAYSVLSKDKSAKLLLFGRVKGDFRANETIGAFTAGHRIYTSHIVEANHNGVCTENTHYTLGDVSPKYAAWCKHNGHDLAAALEEGRVYLP